MTFSNGVTKGPAELTKGSVGAKNIFEVQKAGGSLRLARILNVGWYPFFDRLIKIVKGKF